MMTKNKYTGPMQPAAGLEKYGQKVLLPDKGFSLHIYEAGKRDAPALLLIHGLGDEADSWRHVITPLAGSHRVIAVDLPGFGRSDPSPEPYRASFYSSSILSLMDTLNIPSAVLVGSSMGAMISHRIALEHPERVIGLVLVDGSLVLKEQSGTGEVLLFAVPFLGEWRYNRLRRDPDKAYQTLQGYYADLDRLPEADRAFLYQRVNERVWSDSQRDAYLSTLRQMVRATILHPEVDLDDRIKADQTPLLIIWGEQDFIMPMVNGKALAQMRPNAEFISIPGAGHLPHQEKPSQFLDALRSFLGELYRPN
jgi:pimeloyl-ACP methyl ester carboxylesterase